jgi:hypothetical protein
MRDARIFFLWALRFPAQRARRDVARQSCAAQNARMRRNSFVSILLAVLSGFLPGVAAAYIDMTPQSPTRTVNWAGGDISRNVGFCVVSVQGAVQTGTNPLPYDVRVMSSTGALTLAGPGAAVPVEVDWTDLESNTTLSLAHGVVTTRTNTGVIDPCPAGNNGRATVRILAADLYTRAPGTYSATFTFRVRNSAAGPRRDTATLTLNVVVPTVVHLSGLDSLGLGIWDGSSVMNGSDTLCVFINSGVQYAVTASGSGAGGAFEVSDGSNSIGFSSSWNDGSGAALLVPGVPLGSRGNTNTTSADCAGGSANNATFAVSVPVTNLQSVAGPGTFSGTVTLTVQAQ